MLYHASTMSKTALITGASSGIGYALAKRFAQDGVNLVIVARDETRLGQIATELHSASGVSVKVIRSDLSLPAAPAEIYRETQRSGIEIDYLVNNAGFGLLGAADKLDRAEQLAMIDLNVRALTDLSLAFIDSLKRRKGGILNVASIAAFMPGPGMAVYYATKAYVLSFSEAIANELQGTGVTVTVASPRVTTAAAPKLT